MNLRAINVFTHDSIGLGEDGPTHQSVEHIPSLRLIPGMDVWRPCDTVEAVVAWASAIERRDGASCLIFSRQNAAFIDRDEVDADAIAMGGYVAAEAPWVKARRRSCCSRPVRRWGLRWMRALSSPRSTSMPVWYRCLARTVLTASRRSIVSRCSRRDCRCSPLKHQRLIFGGSTLRARRRAWRRQLR